MNQRKNGLSQGYGAHQLLGQLAGRPQLQKPNVMQPKQHTAAPPVYRPQPVPKVLQTKTAASHHPVSQPKQAPAAPPVYRPQPVPKVLQTKSATVQPSVQARRQPVAPPVYRPEAKKLVQPKAISPLRKAPVAPPVYRPEQQRVSQPKMAAAAPERTPPKAIPVNRPQAKPLIPPTKPVQMKAQTVAPPVSHSQSIQQKAKAARLSAQAAASSRPPLSSASIQLKSARGVVQMTACTLHQIENCQACRLASLLTGASPTHNILPITQHLYSFLEDNDLGRLSMTSKGTNEIADKEMLRRLVKRPFSKGVFSGEHEVGPGKNLADLHVTGEMGGSMGSSDLIFILSHLYEWLEACHKETGVCGVLEWHPTGAVVTKQVVELLAAAFGGWFGLGKALMLKKWRKMNENKVRNKFAMLMDEDILPEYFAFLNCIKGIPGVTITAVGIPKNNSLSVAEQTKAFYQNLLEETPRGETRFCQYQQQYTSGNENLSIKVRIDYYLIPKLIKAIQNNSQ